VLLLCAAAVGSVTSSEIPEGATLSRIGLVEADRTAAAVISAAALAALADVKDASVTLAMHDPADGPWDGTGTAIARMLDGDSMVALVGATDGATAHIAGQIATRRRIPLFTLSPEDSLTRAFDPWIFRVVPGDEEQARTLLRRFAPQRPDPARAIVVVPSGRGGRERLASLRRACAAANVEISAVLHTEDGHLPTTEPPVSDLMLLWLDAGPARTALNRLQRDLAPARLLGSTRLDDPHFLEQLPTWIEGRLAVPLIRTADETARDGESVTTAITHDLVRAIARATANGAEAAGVRETLASTGVPGLRSETFGFDERGNRVGRIPIGLLSRGRLIPASEE
jgi:ABC-type branched-subunit amino acid transport system substrate-binding protein